MQVFVMIVLLTAAVSASNLQNILLQLKRELGKAAPKDCGNKGDVVFLLDASSSLTAEDYELSKAFVKEMMSGFNVKSDVVRVGLASFNRFAEVAFHLDKITEENMDATQLTALVDTVRATSVGTYIDRGLKLVREEMLTETNGARPNVTKLVIVITDGRANKEKEAGEEAELLHSTGALVFAIAVGTWRSDEQLQLLASKPPQNFRFQVNDFSALDSIKKTLTDVVCKDLKEKPILPPACYRKADLLFVIDASKSISQESFQIAKQFVVNFLDSFVVSPQYLRVAAMTFDTYARIAFNLDTYETSDDVKEAIMALTQNKTGTFTDRAFEKARTDIFNPQVGDRLEEPNVIILITDGKSRRPELTKTQAKKTRDFGVSVLTVGVGNKADEEIEAISSSHPITGEKFVFNVDQFDELVNETFTTYNLVNKTCQVPEGPTECNSQLDLIFVVDLSTSLTPNFGKMKDFLKLMTRGYNMSADVVQIGMISFNKLAMMNLKLSAGVDQETVVEAIETLPDPATGTMTWKALDLLRTEGFTIENGGRASATKMAVIISDGKSRNKEKTIEAATAVHDAGITIVVLTVGKTDNEEATAIASTPTVNFLYQAKNFDQMFSFASKLVQTTCAGPSKPDKDILGELRRELVKLEAALTTEAARRRFGQLNFRFNKTIGSATGCRIVEILNDVNESLFVVSRNQSLPEWSFMPPFFKAD